jgi:hypothetical protein
VIKEQGRKYFATKVKRDETILIKTGNEDDYIEIKFVGMSSDNIANFSFKLSENVYVMKPVKLTRKVRTL